MTTLLVASRLCHFLAAMVLFGSAATAGYLMMSLPPPARSIVFSRLRVVQSAAALVAFGSAIVWLLAVAGNMGDGWIDALDPAFVGAVLTETSFGAVWRWRLVLGLAIVVLATRRRPSAAVLTFLAGLNLASIGLTGHAAMEEGAAALMHGVADAIHLLAGAIWIGGLAPLFLAVLTPDGAEGVLRRFSTLGCAAVLAVIITGCVNAWFLVGSLHDLMTTAYGQLLSAKLLLVTTMVGVALFNRFRITPGFSTDPVGSRRWLRRTITLEVVLALFDLVIVAAAGTLPPSAHHAED